MRSSLFLIPGMLAACAAAPAETPVHGVTPSHKCDAASGQRYVGQAATAEIGSAILRDTNAAVFRWAPPGVMLTMDFREDRVTVRTGPDGIITSVKCG